MFHTLRSDSRRIFFALFFDFGFFKDRDDRKIGNCFFFFLIKIVMIKEKIKTRRKSF